MRELDKTASPVHLAEQASKTVLQLKIGEFRQAIARVDEMISTLKRSQETFGRHLVGSPEFTAGVEETIALARVTDIEGRVLHAFRKHKGSPLEMKKAVKEPRKLMDSLCLKSREHPGIQLVIERAMHQRKLD